MLRLAHRTDAQKRAPPTRIREGEANGHAGKPRPMREEHRQVFARRKDRFESP